MIPLILAGGRGERLWPISRKHNPKQFLSLDKSGKSLLEITAERLLPLAETWDNLWVISIYDLAEKIRQQLPHLPPANLLIQSAERDTASAVTWATLEIAKRYGNEITIGAFPSDHWVSDQLEFQRAVYAAELASKQATIVILGIPPTYPSTNFGYLRKGQEKGNFQGLSAYQLIGYIEKPEHLVAEALLTEGEYIWNTGIFIFQAQKMLAELHVHLPEVIEPLELKGASIYSCLPRRSIYENLIPKVQNIYVITANFNWDDLGEWKAIERLFKGDNLNTKLANHIEIDTQGAILYSNDYQDLIVTIGLKDILIVRDGLITLVVDKHRTQDIKKILNLLKTNPHLADLL